MSMITLNYIPNSDLVHVCNNHTKFELHQIRTFRDDRSHFTYSDSLEIDQGNGNWYENVNLSGVYQSKFNTLLLA